MDDSSQTSEQRTIEDTAQSHSEHLISVMQRNLAVHLVYDEPSVAWLAGYIDRMRTQLDKEEVEGMIDAIGCFLGEAIRRSFGGRWAQIEGRIGIEFSKGNAAFPFDKVAKQFENGPGDSILSLYRMVPIFLKDRGAKSV